VSLRRTTIAAIAAGLVLGGPAPEHSSAATPSVAAGVRLVAPPAVVRPGAALRLTDTVRNRARRRVARSTATVLLSADLRRDARDVRLGTRVVPALRRGRSSRRTLTVRVPPATANGQWRVLVCVGTRCRATGRFRVAAVPAPRVPLVAPRPQPRVPRPAPPAPPAPAPTPVAPTPPAPDPAQVVRLRDCGLPADPTARWQAARTGWTGGDGTFSTLLPDGRRVWLFGDTYVGGVRDDGSRDPATPIVRNSMVVEDGGCLETVLHGTAAQPLATFLASGDRWYWPNQAVVVGDTLQVFLTRIRATGTGAYDLAVDGTVLATLSLPDLELVSTTEIPLRPHFFLGSAVVDEGAFTYVYGVDDTAHRAHVARTALGDLDGPYAFWDGSDWSSDPADSVPVLGSVSSNQLSIVPDGADLVLVMQPPFDNRVLTYRAAAPEGPFTSEQVLTTLTPPSGAFTYHAMWHPGVGLSYNVNADTFAGVFADASVYRPRFLTNLDPAARR
jgi:hypothetical protein